MGSLFDDVRHVLLTLLFVLSFGWMAALVVPGTNGGDGGQQVAAGAASAARTASGA